MNEVDRKRGHENGLARRREIATKRSKKAKELLSAGMSVTRIAEHFGVNPRTIQKDLKK